MFRRFIGILLTTGIFSSYAAIKNNNFVCFFPNCNITSRIQKQQIHKKNIFQKKLNQELSILNQKIRNLYKLHAKECAPEEIGKAEAYLDAVNGLEYIDPDSGQIQKTEIKTIDKIFYKNKAKEYIALAKEKVYSDVDGDGIPCYQEIEQGTNPFVAEGKKVPSERKKVQSSQTGYKPLKLHARIHFNFDK